MEAKKLFFGEEGVADVLADMGLTEAEVPSPLSVLRTLSVLFVCLRGEGSFPPSLCLCPEGLSLLLFARRAVWGAAWQRLVY